MPFTNRGKFRIIENVFRGVAPPTNFYVALVTSAVVPTQDTNTKGQLTEIATGNGYVAGGASLNRDAVDFDVSVENDTNDRAELQIKNIVWTASGGTLPSSGNGARYAILTDDNATQANREVWAYWDLLTNNQVSSGQTLSLIDLELRMTEGV